MKRIKYVLFLAGMVLFISCSHYTAKFTEKYLDYKSDLNIEARYPSYKQAIGESLSAEKCQEILSKTKEVQQWVKEML